MDTVKAKLVCIEPTLNPVGQRDNCSIRIASYAEQMKTSDPPPILAVKRSKGNLFILDGNHRYRAAQRMGRAIRAWLVPVKPFRALLQKHFSGSMPKGFGALDEYIICGKDTYKEAGLRD